MACTQESLKTTKTLKGARLEGWFEILKAIQVDSKAGLNKLNRNAYTFRKNILMIKQSCVLSLVRYSNPHCCICPKWVILHLEPAGAYCNSFPSTRTLLYYTVPSAGAAERSRSHQRERSVPPPQQRPQPGTWQRICFYFSKRVNVISVKESQDLRFPSLGTHAALLPGCFNVYWTPA